MERQQKTARKQEIKMQFSTLQTYSRTKPRVFYQEKVHGFDVTDAVFGTPKAHETISEKRGINKKKCTGERKLLGSQNTNVTSKNPQDSKQRKRRILAKKRSMRKSGACRLSKLAVETVDSRMQRTREWLESHVPACNDEHNENSTDSSIELFRKDQSFSRTQKKKLNDRDFSLEELTNEIHCSDRVKEKLKQCDLEPCTSPDRPFILGVTETENENFCPAQLVEITPLICTVEETLDTGSEGDPSLIMRNDVPKYLSSTKQKGVEVNLDSAAEWADLSSITPSPRTAAYRARMIAETTPYKISQPSAVNAPTKVKQPNSKWKRGSQPLSSTCLFKSPDVEIVDCLPDVSSIRSRDGVSMSDVCLAEQKKQMFTQEGVLIRKYRDLSYKLPVHDLQEPKDMEGRKIEQNPVKVLTSTPAKDFVHNNLLKKLQIDVSFVHPPSSDEDVPLDFNHSPRTVNSDEIAPLNLEEIEDNPCFGLQQDEEVPAQVNIPRYANYGILDAKEMETKVSLANPNAIDIASHSTRRRSSDLQVIRISDRIICPVTNPYIFFKQKKNTIQILQKTSPVKSRSKDNVISDIICTLKGITKRTCLTREKPVR